MAESAPSLQSDQSATQTTQVDWRLTKHTESRILLAKVSFGLAIALVLLMMISLIINPFQKQKAADNTTRQEQLIELRSALENYASAHDGRYPTTYGQYWCEDCTYPDYVAKGKNNWVPDLVKDGLLTGLPTDPDNLGGSACRPKPDASFAGYVYYSPAPPDNTEYKVFLQCTPPAYALNQGKEAPRTPYCSQRPPYDSTNLSANPFRDVPLKPFVDPVRYEYAYAIYSPGLACL